MSLWHQQKSITLDVHGPLQTRGETRCPGGVSVSCFASRTRHECPRHNESVHMEAWYWMSTDTYGKWHNHNTPRKRHNNTCVESLAGNCTFYYVYYLYVFILHVELNDIIERLSKPYLYVYAYVWSRREISDVILVEQTVFTRTCTCKIYGFSTLTHGHSWWRVLLIQDVFVESFHFWMT